MHIFFPIRHSYSLWYIYHNQVLSAVDKIFHGEVSHFNYVSVATGSDHFFIDL